MRRFGLVERFSQKPDYRLKQRRTRRERSSIDSDTKAKSDRFSGPRKLRIIQGGVRHARSPVFPIHLADEDIEPAGHRRRRLNGGADSRCPFALPHINFLGE